jgi:hypothetical protein
MDQSNVDAALSGRLNIVKGRLRQIELLQGIEPPRPPEAHSVGLLDQERIAGGFFEEIRRMRTEIK